MSQDKLSGKICFKLNRNQILAADCRLLMEANSNEVVSACPDH